MDKKKIRHKRLIGFSLSIIFLGIWIFINPNLYGFMYDIVYGYGNMERTLNFSVESERMLKVIYVDKLELFEKYGTTMIEFQGKNIFLGDIIKPDYSYIDQESPIINRIGFIVKEHSYPNDKFIGIFEKGTNKGYLAMVSGDYERILSNLDNEVQTNLEKLSNIDLTGYSTISFSEEQDIKIAKTYKYLVESVYPKFSLSKGELAQRGNGYLTLNTKVGVCNGISKAFVYLLNAQGINANIEIGEGCVNGTCMNHAWVRIDKYLYDPTWEIPSSANDTGDDEKRVVIFGKTNYYRVPDYAFYINHIENKVLSGIGEIPDSIDYTGCIKENMANIVNDLKQGDIYSIHHWSIFRDNVDSETKRYIAKYLVMNLSEVEKYILRKFNHVFWIDINGNISPYDSESIGVINITNANREYYQKLLSIPDILNQKYDSKTSEILLNDSNGDVLFAN